MIKNEIVDYWQDRSSGYSTVNKDELAGEQAKRWLCCILEHTAIEPDKNYKVLDIGTGPGFFSIILAKAGFTVTAIDVTENMLEEARQNAGTLADKIDFKIMDAENLIFADNSFDIIVTRNLTWNLTNPNRAYSEWVRVLKKGGTLLNFDANWYCYLTDDEKRKAYNKDRKSAAKHDVEDFYEGTDIEQMESIASRLPLSNINRPKWDIDVISLMGISSVTAFEDIWKKVWSDKEKINFTTTPMFLVKIIK